MNGALFLRYFLEFAIHCFLLSIYLIPSSKIL